MKTWELFKVNNQPLQLSYSQQQIFNSILGQKHRRVQVIAPTQYGKSLTVACAIIARACLYGEKFTILAPSQKKADIIMSYVLEHIFDNVLWYSQLVQEGGGGLEKLKRLKHEKSKKNITLRNGGGIQTLSLNAKDSRGSIEAAMGFGGNRLVLDESSLIDDPIYATVKRMLGGYPYEDTFLFEIGNPFYRNHFYRTWTSSRYDRLFIDYEKALSEERFSPEFIEEMRSEAFFDIFYECKFPDEDAVDAKGYRFLLLGEDILNAFVADNAEINQFKVSPTLANSRKYLGADIGGGGDYSAFVIRADNYAWIESSNRSSDTMTQVQEIERIIEKYKINPYDIFVDDTGIGKGVSDRLKEKNIAINAIAVGAQAKDKTKYKNVKAEAFWGLRTWIKKGGKIDKDSRFEELKEIKYKVSTEKLLQIEPKEELKKRTGKSPDFADAFMLTFASPRPRARAFDFKPPGF